MPSKHKRITLLFNANKAYDRKIIAGVARYLQKGVDWDLYMEEDLITRLDRVNKWRGDGIIADFDNPKVVEFVQESHIAAVAVGGSYQDRQQYPKQIPYVATNNRTIARLGVEHFLSLGYQNLAFYGIPSKPNNRWALERERAFFEFVKRPSLLSIKTASKASELNYFSFRGSLTHYRGWERALEKLMAWLERLPKPVAIMAATDVRARQVFEACHLLEYKIPDQVAILGVDDDEIISDLTGRSLSSVRQGTETMGYTAAGILDRLVRGDRVAAKVHMVEPVGIVQSRSTDYMATTDPLVRAALDFIKQNANQGIQATHVMKHLACSRTTIEQRFKKAINSTIHQEITKVQLGQVKQLLLKTTLPLKEISERCGYNTVQYMVMAFKKQLGITPTEYRNQFN